VLLTIGIPNKPAPYMSGEPFNRCTHTALSPKGEIYVSDGYGNACVHKYTPDGKLMKTWGEPGTDPGQFNIVHNIATDADGWVYVADRENHRVQVFDGNGKYETQWNNLHRPARCAVAAARSRPSSSASSAPACREPEDRRISGPRLDHRGRARQRASRALGGENGPGLEVGKFLAPHGIALDSKGDIYLGEVGRHQLEDELPRPRSDAESGALRCRSSSKVS
jgi:DNA-binding beta-propeller fold protein YncE